MIRVLLDENVPRAAIEALRESGMDVHAVVEDLAGAPDHVVLDVARTEHRFLLTLDLDFGKLIYGRGNVAPPGVILLRFAPAHPLEPADVFIDLANHSEITLHGRYVRVTPSSRLDLEIAAVQSIGARASSHSCGLHSHLGHIALHWLRR